ARWAEQVASEDARPGRLGVYAQPPAVMRIGADQQVLAVEVLLRAVGDEPAPKPVVMLLADRPVDLAPPDLAGAGRLVDDELVLRRPTCVVTGPHDQRPLGSDQSLAGPDRILDQLRRGQIRKHAATDRRRGSGGDRCRRVIVPSGRAGGGHMTRTPWRGRSLHGSTGRAYRVRFVRWWPGDASGSRLPQSRGRDATTLRFGCDTVPTDGIRPYHGPATVTWLIAVPEDLLDD